MGRHAKLLGGESAKHRGNIGANKRGSVPEVSVWMAASHAGQRDCRISEADCGRGGEREPGVTACISGENEWPGVASGKGKAGIFKKDDVQRGCRGESQGDEGVAYFGIIMENREFMADGGIRKADDFCMWIWIVIVMPIAISYSKSRRTDDENIKHCIHRYFRNAVLERGRTCQGQ